MIRLPDGTSVWLNAGSKLTYEKDFGENIREVNLTGEAYFDVVRNVQKPFIIHTKALDIKVLGTRFNVKSYPDEKTTETSLIKGSIEVTIKNRRADKIIMKPNEKLVIANEAPEETRSAERKRSVVNAPIITLSHLNYFSIDSTIIETSWVENRLVFEDESFAELSLKLSRWYGVHFHFNAPEIEKLRFTGNFKEETIHEALSAMKITATFNYKIDHNNIEISK
jgi:ferric-dicitrate binding protein FerR (iron transport regulator)